MQLIDVGDSQTVVSAVDEQRSERLKQFFTEERISYYETLPQRYPLWCGDWPDAERWTGEHSAWSQAAALERDVMADRREDKRIDAAVFTAVLERKFDGLEKLPPETAALLLATYYTFSHVAFDPFGKLEAGSFLRQLRGGLGTIFEPLSPIRPNIVTLLARIRGLDGQKYLRYRRGYFLVSEAARDLIRKDLESSWIRIGRHIGALPGAKGGRLCGLGDKFLAGLQKEGERLVADVAEFTPDAATLDLLREDADARGVLSTGMKADVEWERYQNLLRRRDELLLDEKELLPDENVRLEGLQAKVDRELRLPERAKHLAFPMLSNAEIIAVVAEVGSKPGRRKTAKVATDLLEGRLPISRKTIVRRISAYR